jgi:hypothetical protein
LPAERVLVSRSGTMNAEKLVRSVHFTIGLVVLTVGYAGVLMGVKFLVVNV